MIELDLSADLRPMLQRLDGLQREIPFVIASALTKTAVRVRPEIQKEIDRAFDRPTPYTRNSLFVQPAKKSDANPIARLAFKDTQSARGGYLSAQYLSPFIDNSPRHNKAFENRLREAGLLPAGMKIIPGKGAKLDRYGNLDQGQLVGVLSKLKAASGKEIAKRFKRRAARYEGADYFVSRCGRLHRGVWQQVPGHGVKPIYLFVNRILSRRFFNFEGVAMESALKFLPVEFEAAIDRVLRD